MAEERVNRKLAAILAADVVGYSRLMDADEEGTLSALKQQGRPFSIQRSPPTMAASSS
jgi:adenylate cyclase